MTAPDPVVPPEPAMTLPPPYEPNPAAGQPAAPGGYVGPPAGPAGFDANPAPEAAARDVMAKVASFWWLFLVTGILWIIVGIVVLQLNATSVFVVGFAVAGMLMAMGVQEVLVASAVDHLKALRYGLGIFFLIGGMLALFNPAWTTASLAASLGWLFFLVGVFWIVDAIAERDESKLWLLGLGAGIVMILLAVWAGLQYSATKLATLLIVAGVWALMRGVVDILRAFQFKKLGSALRADG